MRVSWAKGYFLFHSRDAIVTWIKKKTGPGVDNITTVDDAERVLTSENKVVLGYLNHLKVLGTEEFNTYQRHFFWYLIVTG